MTQIEAGTLPATTVPLWVSRAGALCVAAGILGAVSTVHSRAGGDHGLDVAFAALGYALWTADD